MSESELLVPPDAILVHIGPYKTGSTLIQMTMHERREALAEAGVHYPGPLHRPIHSVAGLLGWRERGRMAPRQAAWDRFAAKIAAQPGRVCISNEALASADAEQVQRLLRDLGPDRVHMILTARRLDKLLPSAWQERVKSVNEVRGYPEWLAKVIAAAPAPDATLADIRRRAFWANHSMAALLGAWAALPPERITVVVAGEGDRARLTRTFENMLGLPEDMLLPTVGGNKSLGWEQVELLRHLNRAFDQAGWSDGDRRRLLQYGMVDGFRNAERASEVALPPLSREQAEQVAELSRRRIAEIEASGARVVGDLAELMPPAPAEAVAVAETPQSISIQSAVAAITGMVEVALRDHHQLADEVDELKTSGTAAPSAPGVARRLPAKVSTTATAAARALVRRVRDWRSR